MPTVDSYNVKAPKKITLTTKPGDDVSGYAGKLFFFNDIDDPDDNGITKETWTSDQLEKGASFDFDATGKQQYQIALTATATKATTLDTTVKFSIGIDPSHHVVSLVTATLNELTWNFISVE